MALLKSICQKIDTISYKLKAKKYRQSSEWKNHTHNVKPQATDWDAVHQNLIKICEQHNVTLKDFEVNKSDYIKFKKEFNPPASALYAINCREKKMMEHYIAYDLLDIKKNERYVDIASENSPFPEMLRDRFGIEAYSQDLTYASGTNGYQIGSSADTLPVNDNWIDKASLQCAFEHFEGKIDSNFIKELSRALNHNGKCVIIPLYLSSEFLNIYDPILYKSWDNKNADPEAKVIAEIGLGGFFERLYSPEQLSRIFIPDINLKYTLYRITGKENAIDNKNPQEIKIAKRVRYALEIEKI